MEKAHFSSGDIKSGAPHKTHLLCYFVAVLQRVKSILWGV